MASIYEILHIEYAAVDVSIFGLKNAIDTLDRMVYAAPEIVDYLHAQSVQFVVDAADAATHVHGVIQAYNWPVQYDQHLSDFQNLQIYLNEIRQWRDKLTVAVGEPIFSHAAHGMRLNAAIARLTRMLATNDPGPPALHIDVESRVCAICVAPAHKRCAACKTVRYCGLACQAIHWEAGHQETCSAVV
jgi:hypothetical protein